MLRLLHCISLFIFVSTVLSGCVKDPPSEPIQVSVAQLYCSAGKNPDINCVTNPDEFLNIVDLLFRASNDSALTDFDQDPYALFSFGFLQDALAVCSGYVPQLGNDSCPYATIGTPQAKMYVPKPVIVTKTGTDKVQIAIDNTVFGANAEQTTVSLYPTSESTDASLPVYASAVTAVDQSEYFRIFETPGTSFISRKTESGFAVVNAIGSRSVLLLLLIALAMSFIFGIVMYAVEMFRSRETTSIPTNPVHGIPYSCWYTTCTMISVDFGFTPPRSNAAQSVVLTWKYVTYIILALLNAEVLLSIQPFLIANNVDEVKDLHGLDVGVIHGAPDDLRVAIAGGNLHYFDDSGSAIEALCNGDLDLVAVDTITTGTILKYGCESDKEYQGRLRVSGTVRDATQVGVVISREISLKDAIDLEGNVGAPSIKLGGCLQQMIKVGTYPVRRKLAKYVGTAKNPKKVEEHKDIFGIILQIVIPAGIVISITLVGVVNGNIRRTVKRRRIRKERNENLEYAELQENDLEDRLLTSVSPGEEDGDKGNIISESST